MTRKLLAVKTVRLRCHHYSTVTVADSDTLPASAYCPQCNCAQLVLEVLRWGRAKCLTCQWAYKGRVDRAEARAYGHSDRYPSHMVQCWEGSKLMFTTTLARSQSELPLFQEPPPF